VKPAVKFRTIFFQTRILFMLQTVKNDYLCKAYVLSFEWRTRIFCKVGSDMLYGS
jgi:hypothetical protein